MPERTRPSVGARGERWSVLQPWRGELGCDGDLSPLRHPMLKISNAENDVAFGFCEARGSLRMTGRVNFEGDPESTSTNRYTMLRVFIFLPELVLSIAVLLLSLR